MTCGGVSFPSTGGTGVSTRTLGTPSGEGTLAAVALDQSRGFRRSETGLYYNSAAQEHYEQGRAHGPIPDQLDGVPTQVILTDAFRAFGWNEKQAQCCRLR